MNLAFRSHKGDINPSLMSILAFINIVQVLFFSTNVLGSQVRENKTYMASAPISNVSSSVNQTSYSDIISPRDAADLSQHIVLDEKALNISEIVSHINKYRYMGGDHEEAEQIERELDSLLNSRMMTQKRGSSQDILFNIKPKLEQRFQDASQSKCYILAVTGGGAKGSYSSGALNGLAMRYRALGVKLRWDIASGVSIGALNTIWRQFHLPTQSVHFTTEGASIWNFFSKDNVHNCKDSVIKVSSSKIIKLVRALNKKPGYFCSSYPIYVFMRHLVQNRRRFKGSHWSALAFNYRAGVPYLFNEETPISLLPSVIRASTAFPLILEPAEIEGLGVFGDGSISKTINIQEAINRCFQTGKAKTDDDVVVDIVSTSISEDEHLFSFEPKESKTLFEVLTWFFYYYYLTPTYQQYEIVQAIRRYPNIRFRHFITPDKNSVVDQMPIFGFDSKQMQNALVEGFNAGFNSSSSFYESWRFVRRDLSHHTEWKPFNHDEMVLPKSDKFVSNPDTDAFVEFPSLVSVKYNENIIANFKKLFELELFTNGQANRDANKTRSDRIRREFYRRQISSVVTNLHSHLLGIRHTELSKEFVRKREYMSMFISENERETKRMTEFARKCMAKNFGGYEAINATTSEKTGNEDKASVICVNSPKESPFFEADRRFVTSLRTNYVNAYNLVRLFSNKDTRKKYKSILKEEKKLRKILDESSSEFYRLREKLYGLYDRYDELMVPLNELYLNLKELVKGCKHTSASQNLLLFPFLEGEDSNNLIWAPSGDYDTRLTEYHLDSMINVIKSLYPSFNMQKEFNFVLSEGEVNKGTRRADWNSYKKTLASYIENSDESLCWVKSDKIKQMFKYLTEFIHELPYIEMEHYKLVTDITNIHILLTKIQMAPRIYTAYVESLLRKDTLRNLELIQDIRQTTSRTGDLNGIEDEHTTGINIGGSDIERTKRVIIGGAADIDRPGDASTN